MKHVSLLILSILALPASAIAQEIVDQPICFTIRNEAPYKVYGQMASNYYTTPDGIKARHTGTFRLEAAGTRHKEKGYLLDRTEFCSTGPFYPNRQMELTLRTLIPIFYCKTSIELGEIVIHGTAKKDKAGKTWAECY